jgi:hypothetical protein
MVAWSGGGRRGLPCDSEKWGGHRRNKRLEELKVSVFYNDGAARYFGRE